MKAHRIDKIFETSRNVGETLAIGALYSTKNFWKNTNHSIFDLSYLSRYLQIAKMEPICAGYPRRET